MQKPRADQFADSPLDCILVSEVGLPRVHRARDLGDGELMIGVLVKQKGQDGPLDLAVLTLGDRGTALSATRRVLVSHEELCLLVVRLPVGVDAPPGAAFLLFRQSSSGVEKTSTVLLASDDLRDPAAVQSNLFADVAQ